MAMDSEEIKALGNFIKNPYRNLPEDAFRHLVIQFKDVGELMMTAVKIIQGLPQIPPWVETSLESIIEAYNNLARNMFSFKIDLNKDNSIRVNSMVQAIQNFISNVRYPNNPSNPDSVGIEKDFIGIYAVILGYANQASHDSLSLENFRAASNEVNVLRNKLQEELDHAKKAREEVLVKKTSEVSENFSRFYQAEARENSGLSKNYPWVGAAQLWLLGGIISFCILLWAIYDFSVADLKPDGAKVNVNQNVLLVKPDSLHPGIQKPEIISAWADPSFISNLLRHILIISLFIYITRFCFRQFNIRRHLYTTNRHKANLASTLDSLLKSTWAAEPELRQTALSTVIQSLAQLESTGYIDEKNPDVNLPILELSKLATNK